MFKRIALATIVAVTGLAFAVPDAHAEGATRVVFDNLSFTMTPDRCNQIPEGTEINGTGDGRWLYTERTDRSGTNHYREEAFYSGTAIDQDGNTYRWKYSSYFVSETTAAGDVSGYIVDTFVLAGQPLGYVTRFRANLGPSGFTPVWVHGDPFDFELGEGRCDPL